MAEPPRYEREAEFDASPTPDAVIPPAGHAEAISESGLSLGSRALISALMALGGVATFPGGGVGLEYADLLKRAARPDLLAPHLAEVGARLRDLEVDLLLVPGHSGHPIGIMYAMSAEMPVLLLNKGPLPPSGGAVAPGAFIVPSYTGESDVLVTPDSAALLAITGPLFARQMERGEPLRLRVAGADDILDKGVMAHAVSDCALRLGRFAQEAFARDRGEAVSVATEVVTWATPFVKRYTGVERRLTGVFQEPPMAGLAITGLALDPPAVGIDGVGWLGFQQTGVQGEARRDGHGSLRTFL